MRVEPIGNMSASPRWVLGLDLESRTNSQLALQIANLAGESFTVCDLRSPELIPWRMQAVGADASLQPTLFEVNEHQVHAWTGASLVSRLARRIGPLNTWRLLTIVGERMDSASPTESVSRRSVLRYGLSGAAAAIALANVGAASPVALAVGSEGAQLLEGLSAAEERGLAAEKLRNKDANQIEQRAENDRSFNRLNDYFAHEDGRDWRQHGREAYRILKNGRRVRDAFWITLKNPGEDQWVHVMYAREDGGKENTSGLLWRGDGRKGQYSNRFYVQNGNVRNDNGQVEGASLSAQSAPDDLDQIICPFATYGPCGVATAVIAAACFIPLVGVVGCTTGSVVAAGCLVIAGDSNEECKKLDGS